MTIGRLTITGQFPLEIDGLSLGYSGKRRIVMSINEQGFFEWQGKMFKTREPAQVLTALGIVNAKWSLSYKI